MTILLVEYEPALAAFIQDVLEREGMPCLTAADLDEAEWMLAIAAVDVLVVDVGIGGQDAIGWVERVCAGKARLFRPPLLVAHVQLDHLGSVYPAR